MLLQRHRERPGAPIPRKAFEPQELTGPPRQVLCLPDATTQQSRPLDFLLRMVRLPVPPVLEPLAAFPEHVQLGKMLSRDEGVPAGPGGSRWGECYSH